MPSTTTKTNLTGNYALHSMVEVIVLSSIHNLIHDPFEVVNLVVHGGADDAVGL